MKFTIRKARNCSFFLHDHQLRCVSLLRSGRKSLVFRERNFQDALIKLPSGCVTLSIKILRQKNLCYFEGLLKATLGAVLEAGNPRLNQWGLLKHSVIHP